MVVLKLVEKSNQDAIDAALFLLDEAKKGDFNISATFCHTGEEEEALLTGAYKANPDLAVMASLKLMGKLLKP